MSINISLYVQICTSILHLVNLLQALDLDLLHQLFMERSQVISVHFDRFRTSPEDGNPAQIGTCTTNLYKEDSFYSF